MSPPTNARVIDIRIAPGARLPSTAPKSVTIETGHGIAGDRYENATHRQVTVQSIDEIAEAEAEVGRRLEPALTRRNITIEGGLLDRTPGARLTVGEVELEVVRDAAPCKLLEDTLGRDAKLALHKRAGVVCRTLTGGVVSIGDLVRLGGDTSVRETQESDREAG
ncbi:MAG: MOSC domain-containing protein [Acidimicrobiales bacterium]